jgi:hypothetical protein
MFPAYLSDTSPAEKTLEPSVVEQTARPEPLRARAAHAARLDGTSPRSDGAPGIVSLAIEMVMTLGWFMALDAFQCFFSYQVFA